MKYAGKPKSDNKETERRVWEMAEQQAIGARILFVILASLLTSIFILHLKLLLAVFITIALCIFAVVVMKDAHNKAFDLYWDYWLKRKD